MKKNKLFSLRNWALLLAFIALFAYSCKKEVNTATEPTTDKNYISAEQAAKEAVSFMNVRAAMNRLSSTSSNGFKTTNRTISSIKNYEAKDGINAFYVINYKEGGFAIVAADRRVQKVLAFSYEGGFDTEGVKPGGLTEWMSAVSKDVQKVRADNLSYSGLNKKDWLASTSAIKDHAINKNPPVDTTCHEWTEEIEPLLQTEWSQEEGYNNVMPLLACGPGGRAYTGCVPTAMAQVIRYHQFPSTWYNYSIMQDQINYLNIGYSGTTEIANLMHDAAASVSASYGCSGTGAYDTDIPGALKSIFGYASSTISKTYGGSGSGGSRYMEVQDELRASRPVIFSGEPSSGPGHCWVSDGFFSAFICGENGSYTGAMEVLYFHMNWGWNGNYNGYFAFADFSVAGLSFNDNTRVVVGIHP